MKKGITVIIVILAIILGYLGYKVFNLYYYDYPSLSSIKIDKTIKIKTTPLKENEYLSFLDAMKIKNDFQNFKKSDVSNNIDETYILTENNLTKAVFKWGVSNSYVDMLKSDNSILTDDNRINNKNVIKLLEKNNITNDIELFKFLQNQKKEKNNLFTTVKTMQDRYIIYYLTDVMLPDLKSISLIDGDYQGYILNSTNIKQVSILKNGRLYYFTFMQDYFTDSYIESLLNTIVIN